MSRKLLRAAQKQLDQEPRCWHLFDASNQPVGRLAQHLARLLAGKHKPTFNQRLDRGDFVVVLNVDKVAMDGPRWDVKKYTSHSGYPGGKKTISAEKLVQKFPERVLEKAVWGMLPKNNYRLARMWRLKLINGSEHQFNDKFENAQVYRVGLSEQDRAVLAVE